MGKIFCLMGKSSSGKDTIFTHIKENKDLNLKSIILYTTRPKRINENDGVQYYFINENKLEQYKNLGRIIEVRKYNTVNGPWYYATIDDGQINLDKNNYLIIATLEAYSSLKLYFGDENVFPIYINMDDGVRLERALKRERKQKQPNYNELCRRFLADDLDFSKENLYNLKIKKEYLNYDLEECIKEIENDIKNNI